MIEKTLLQKLQREEALLISWYHYSLFKRFWKQSFRFFLHYKNTILELFYVVYALIQNSLFSVQIVSA